MSIKERNYDNSTTLPDTRQQPLLIGCSGGGGHIAAIKGIAGFLTNACNNVDLASHKPVLHEEKTAVQSPARNNIELGLRLMYGNIMSPSVRTALTYSRFPVLPAKTHLHDEISKLDKAEQNLKEKRQYVDMLLDAYPAGYESAAVWNVLQRQDKVAELKKLIALQERSDAENYLQVKTFFLKKLLAAADKGKPFTEIISTQAMALPALCDAVKEYNHWLTQSVDETIKTYPRIVIHQYMTDLPTQGAVHFFNPLANLTHEQAQQMRLYGVDFKDNIAQQFLPNAESFAGIYTIPAHQNPMVRQGFKDPSLDNSQNFTKDLTLALDGVTADEQQVSANAQIASIMLGSQASLDTVNYIEHLLKNGYDKVFVFGGKNADISTAIEAIIAKNTSYQQRIVRLGNQNDRQIAPLMSRSNMVIIRGGGLSVMEQMAMNHNPLQTVLIHHADSNAKELSSGISWEDENVNQLISSLTEKKVFAQKTSPERAAKQIKQARLITALKAINNFNEQTKTIVLGLTSKKLQVFIALLDTNYLKENPEKLISFLDAYTDNCETAIIKNRWLMALENVIAKGLSELTDHDAQCFFDPINNELFFTKEYIRRVFDKIGDCVENYQPNSDALTKHYTSLHIAFAKRNFDQVKDIIQQAAAIDTTPYKQYSRLLALLDHKLQISNDVDLVHDVISEELSYGKSDANSLDYEQAKKVTPETASSLFNVDFSSHFSIICDHMAEQFADYERKAGEKLAKGAIFKGTFFAANYLVNTKLTQDKIKIAQAFRHVVKTAKDVTTIKEGQPGFKKNSEAISDMVCLLLISQDKNNYTSDKRLSSPGELGKKISENIDLLKTKYPIAFHEGHKKYVEQKNQALNEQQNNQGRLLFGR